jgi:hypothetical protein
LSKIKTQNLLPSSRFALEFGMKSIPSEFSVVYPIPTGKSPTLRRISHNTFLLKLFPAYRSFPVQQIKAA